LALSRKEQIEQINCDRAQVQRDIEESAALTTDVPDRQGHLMLLGAMSSRSCSFSGDCVQVLSLYVSLGGAQPSVFKKGRTFLVDQVSCEQQRRRSRSEGLMHLVCFVGVKFEQVISQRPDRLLKSLAAM
jgi:hypothetical protein